MKIYLSDALLLLPVVDCVSLGRNISDGSDGECAGSNTTCSCVLTYCSGDCKTNIYHNLYTSRILL